MFHKNDRVQVKRDIFRWSFATGGGVQEEVLYAKEGEQGVVTDLFLSDNGSGYGKWNAKVLIEGQIKTFRLTSLEKIVQ